MTGEAKTDMLTQAMQCAHPTAEPSAALVGKVAQLAEAKVSELAWRETALQKKVRGALKLRRVLLGILIVSVLSFGVAVGPRLFYGVSLWQATQRLEAAPLLKTTSYRVRPDGTQHLVGTFYVRHQGKTIQARLERDDLLAIWNDKTLYLTHPGSSLVEKGQSALWNENPLSRAQFTAMESVAFFFSHSARLERLPDGRLISQHPDRDQRLLIRQAKKGMLIELELQVRKQNHWSPLLRTVFETEQSVRSELFDTRFLGKKILDQENLTPFFESTFVGTKLILRHVFVNSQGEVYICLGIPSSLGANPTFQYELTDEKGRRYISTGKLSAAHGLWFFPVGPSSIPKTVHLTVRHTRAPDWHFTKVVTVSPRQLPQYPAYYDTLQELLDQKAARLAASLEDAKRRKRWQDVLTLTDEGQKLCEEYAEIMGRLSATAWLMLYRTEALRELGRSAEARITLTQVSPSQLSKSQHAWREQEERQLYPK